MAKELVELAETRAEAKKMAAKTTRRLGVKGCKAYVRAYEMKGLTGWRTVYGVYVPQKCFKG
jgi:hypothetical protein